MNEISDSIRNIRANDLANLMASAIAGDLVKRTNQVWTVHPTREDFNQFRFLVQTIERVRVFQIIIPAIELPIDILSLVYHVKANVDYVLGYWEVR